MTGSFNARVEQRDAERAAARSRTGADAALDVLAGIPARAVEVRAQFARDLEAARTLDVEVQGTARRDRMVAEATQRAAAAVARLRADGEEAVADVVDWQRRTAVKPSAEEMLLREMQEQRAWARLRPLLDSGRHITELIERAREARDVASLRALRAELPTYSEVDGAAIRGVIGLRAATEQLDAALLAVLDEPERGLLDVEQRRAELAPAAERAVEHVEAAVASFGIVPGTGGERELRREILRQDIRANGRGSSSY